MAIEQPSLDYLRAAAPIAVRLAALCVLAYSNRAPGATADATEIKEPLLLPRASMT